jgi:hypothetical protein
MIVSRCRNASFGRRIPALCASFSFLSLTSCFPEQINALFGSLAASGLGNQGPDQIAELIDYELVCNDGIDEDGDGLIDYEHPDCADALDCVQA